MKIAAPIAIFAAISCTPALAYDCTPTLYGSAKLQITALFATGVLENSSYNGANILIDDRFWRNMPFKEKEAFAERLICAAAGPGKGFSVLTIRSRMTGKPVGEWNMGTLSIP